MKKTLFTLLISVFFADSVYSANVTFNEEDVLSRFVLLSVFCMLVLLVLSISIILILYRSIKRKNRKILELMEMLNSNEISCPLQDESVPDICASQDVANAIVQPKPSSSVGTGDFELFRQFDENVHKDQLYLNYNLGRDDYSRIMGVDKNKFGYIIKEYGGGNLSSYLNSLRLEYSLQLLCTFPDMPVNEIASRSAFPNASTYYRLFREKYGQSPNAYRIGCCKHNAKLSVGSSAVA